MMKKYILTLAAVLITLTASAQQKLYLCFSNGYDTVEAEEINVSYSDNTVTINGTSYDISTLDSISFSKPTNLSALTMVTITYNGTSASVTVPSSISGVTYTVSGADVVITSTNTSDEITYEATGSSTNGSLIINGEYKLTLRLNGLDLTSTGVFAPINIKNGKRNALILVDGTINSLTDSANDTISAPLHTKGHLEIDGLGTLNITGNHKHGISTKEYLQIKSTAGTINILSTVSDGIHAGQYFQMNGGTVNIANTGGDGIQAEVTDDTTDENNGEMIIKGGTINATMAEEDTKAMKADADITISGGTITLYANGNGSRGIQTDTNITIGEDDTTTTIYIEANGGLCTAEEDAEDPHRCMGMKADDTVTINAGTITVKNNGTKSRGIRCGTYVKNGGTVSATVKQG